MPPTNPTTVDAQGYESTGLTLDMGFTPRGFARASFTDRHGVACSLQESSLATEPAIWFGATSLHVEAFGGAGNPGWQPIDVAALAGGLGFQAVSSNERMHLTQAQVQALLPLLQHFAAHGDLRLPTTGV